jgi:hypothetical protein
MPESLKIFIIFFLKENIGVFWEFWYDVKENSNGGLKLKNRYPKLILFKVWVLNCKSDER